VFLRPATALGPGLLACFPGVIDSGLVEVSQGEQMLYSGTDPESYITEYTLVYEDESTLLVGGRGNAIGTLSLKFRGLWV